MFRRAFISDVFRLAPDSFKDKIGPAIKDEINRVYSGRVIKDLGLCICVEQFASVGELKTVPGDGGSYVEVEFYIIVFNPSPGSLMRARVTNISEAGLILSSDFFSEFFIPFAEIPHPATLSNNQISIIYNEDVLTIGFLDEVVFRVQQVDFVDKFSERPIIKGQAEIPDSPVARLSKSPMIVIGTLLSEGLGPVQWWFNEEEIELCIEEQRLILDEEANSVSK